jgi:hypothetical protein
LRQRDTQLLPVGPGPDKLTAETRLQTAENLGRYLTEAVVLVEQGKRIPARVRRAAGQFLDGAQELLFIAGLRRQRVEPRLHNLAIYVSAQRVRRGLGWIGCHLGIGRSHE